MIKYEFKHPNHGWQGIQALCDARNFALLMDWPVRTTPVRYTSIIEMLFNLVMSRRDKTLLEVLSTPDARTFKPTVEAQRPGQEEIYPFELNALTTFDCQIVRVCSASDPAGMAMPLKVQSGDLWMLPIPEEVFGLKGAYVRIVVPKELVR